MDIDFSQVKAVRLSRLFDLSKFDCGDQDINDFLKNDAITYQDNKLATTTIFVYNEQVIGFFSAAADSIKLKFKEKQDHHFQEKPIQEFPAIKIARIGRDFNYNRQGIGTNILKWSIGYVLGCSEMIAVRFITVDAYPNKVKWYEQFGFVRNLDDKYTRKDNHVSMRYDLFNGSLK
ncbi:GNAT family N-acetyltransferase [Candidatus Woesearchaeota archaeon]|nr:GNAT family N-acetyltransferase [Candidatus Woesearchaeota archaeon]